MLKQIIAASSPPWHRRERKKRSKARKRLKKHPTGYTQDQIASDLLLLESHNSKPVYRVRQVMSGWNTSGWKGQYWGTRKSRGRNQSTSNVPKDKPKEKETNQFPTYNTMVVGQTEQAASAASSSKGDSVWQSALRSLLRSNPGLNILQEIATALEDNTNGMTQDAKSELYMRQKHLNMRRKATQRIERLEAALQRKKLQVAAFQEQLKKQLKQELC